MVIRVGGVGTQGGGRQALVRPQSGLVGVRFVPYGGETWVWSDRVSS